MRESKDHDATFDDTRDMLTVVKIPNAKHGFVLLPCRWVVQHSLVSRRALPAAGISQQALKSRRRAGKGESDEK
jgi:hypothetical protein